MKIIKDIYLEIVKNKKTEKIKRAILIKTFLLFMFLLTKKRKSNLVKVNLIYLKRALKMRILTIKQILSVLQEINLIKVIRYKNPSKLNHIRSMWGVKIIKNYE